MIIGSKVVRLVQVASVRLRHFSLRQAMRPLAWCPLMAHSRLVPLSGQAAAPICLSCPILALRIIPERSGGD